MNANDDPLNNESSSLDGDDVARSTLVDRKEYSLSRKNGMPPPSANRARVRVVQKKAPLRAIVEFDGMAKPFQMALQLANPNLPVTISGGDVIVGGQMLRQGDWVTFPCDEKGKPSFVKDAMQIVRVEDRKKEVEQGVVFEEVMIPRMIPQELAEKVAKDGWKCVKKLSIIDGWSGNPSVLFFYQRFINDKRERMILDPYSLSWRETEQYPNIVEHLLHSLGAKWP